MISLGVLHLISAIAKSDPDVERELVVQMQELDNELAELQAGDREDRERSLESLLFGSRSR